MKSSKTLFVLSMSVALIVTHLSCSSQEPVTLGGSNLESIMVDQAALYPETILYNPKTEKFLVGSFRDGAIYEIDEKGNSKKFIEDERLNSVLGIELDEERNRLLVVNSDIGSGIRSYPEGPKKQVDLAIFELSTGRLLHYIDLRKVRPNGNHLGNGITIDSEGNAYITDSFSPVIYKVDRSGIASVFLESERFIGEGINLNGIVYHPEGYLLTVKKSDGVIFKIPLEDPEAFSEIQLDKKVYGGDGLLLVDNETLVLVSNIASGVETESAMTLKSTDNWSSSEILDEYKLPGVYPTTATIKDDKIYALHSNLNILNNSPREEQAQLAHKAIIQQIGTLKR